MSDVELRWTYNDNIIGYMSITTTISSHSSINSSRITISISNSSLTLAQSLTATIFHNTGTPSLHHINKNSTTSKTIVSETIPKLPLAKTQAAVGKQKLHSAKRGYLFHCRNYVKNCLPCKISLKSGNRLLSYGQDKIFNMAWLSSSSKCTVMYQILSKWFFIEIWQFNDLQYGGRPPHWNFKI